MGATVLDGCMACGRLAGGTVSGECGRVRDASARFEEDTASTDCGFNRSQVMQQAALTFSPVDPLQNQEPGRLYFYP
eukprot:401535-Pelagomonas_calceolata.AAC.1